jgi:transposase
MSYQRKHKSVPKIVNLDVLEQINLNAAGLDIGAAEIWVSVPEDRDDQPVRVFPTFTVDLQRLADWLTACGIETVAMESTGVYWIPVYDILEARGFKVYLVNARHIKNVSGRKTDVLDCQWIRQLHTYGLLNGSFRPESDMLALRSYLRHRDSLIRYRSAHIQQMQKALQLMNLQLTNVISDITGQTGMQIIRAMVAGEQDPVKLAQYRDPRCRSSQDELAKALTGHYRPEHLFMLKQAVELYDVYTEQMRACDAEIERQYSAIKPIFDEPLPPLPPASKKHRRQGNAPDYDLRAYLYQLTGVDLTLIDGLEVLSIQTILAEVGLDMSQWPSVKHFTSWLRLAPNNDVSGGRVLRRSTPKTQNRATQAFRMAAQSLSHSQSALGGYYRRMRAKHGAPKAITATAHKLARIFYYMLKDRKSYNDPGQDYYEQKYRERVINNLKRRAKELGLELVPSPTANIQASVS